MLISENLEPLDDCFRLFTVKPGNMSLIMNYEHT